jgi:hypothetical protein
MLIAVLLMFGSCGGSSIPESSLTVRDAQSNLLISTSEITGTISLNVGEVRQLQVMRTYRASSGNTLTDDVTQFTNFKWEIDSGAAAINQLGNLQGVTPGTQVLEAKFRTSSLDPWDICRLVVEVN